MGIQSPLATSATLNIYPNPNNGDFLLTYNLPEKSNVRVSVIDLTGREIVEISEKAQMAGDHQQEIAIAGNQLSAGIYMVKLQANNQVYVKKLVIE